MRYLDLYIYAIIFIKIIFIGLAVTHIYNEMNHKENTKQDKQIIFWKERDEFIFVIMMAILLIYLFNPLTSKPPLINKETKILLYLFGIILLITAKWQHFIGESALLEKVQYSLK